jgi:hypothetical protein
LVWTLIDDTIVDFRHNVLIELDGIVDSVLHDQHANSDEACHAQQHEEVATRLRRADLWFV